MRNTEQFSTSEQGWERITEFCFDWEWSSRVYPLVCHNDSLEWNGLGVLPQSMHRARTHLYDNGNTRDPLHTIWTMDAWTLYSNPKGLKGYWHLTQLSAAGCC